LGFEKTRKKIWRHPKASLLTARGPLVAAVVAAVTGGMTAAKINRYSD